MESIDIILIYFDGFVLRGSFLALLCHLEALDAYFILVSMKHLLRAMIIKNLIGLEQLWRVMTT